MTSVPPNDLRGQSLVDELRHLRSEAVELIVLGYQLRQSIDVALARIEPASPRGSDLRQVVINYLRTSSNAQLRRDLLEARGQASVAHLRTRLSLDLEQRTGRRHRNGAGQPRIHTANGNGATMVAAE